MDNTASTIADDGSPREIGGYTVLERFTSGLTWLAAAPGGRRVVLKVLDEDCLWKNQLHPNIKDRLGRVRELAHTGVSNLYGVERADSLVYAVWEYVPGQTLDQFALPGDRPRRDLIPLCRDLMLALEMLHARGIVHGAVKPSNVIVCADENRLMLTHVSPWLYTEPQEDVRAAVAMLRDIVHRRGEAGTPCALLLDDPATQELSPRQLAARLGALTESHDPGAEAAGEFARPADRRQGDPIRRRALAGAALTVVFAAAIFAALRIHANRQQPPAPEPPEAPPAALRPPENTLQ